MRPLILLVDDHDFARPAIQRALDRFGFESRTAASVDEAWPLLEQYEPHAIMTDLHMPGASGLDFLRRLRRDPKYRNLPVAVYSADPLLDRSVEEEIRQLHGLFFAAVMTPTEIHDIAGRVVNLADLTKAGLDLGEFFERGQQN